MEKSNDIFIAKTLRLPMCIIMVATSQLIFNLCFLNAFKKS